ncbi:MAG: ABC transporter ATP-binding protein, partial [Oscillospiraceae bacterium]
ALLCSIISVLSSLIYPLILQRAFDVTIPAKNYGELILLSVIALVTILISIVLICYRSHLMVIIGQSIVYDIRKDLFEHLQKLSFQFYDDRPQGKILTRVIHYVNNVSDILSNGIISFFLEILNIIFIGTFMFMVNVPLSLVVVAGVPIFLALILAIKPKQRRVWQTVSNKGSNLNAYTQESIDGAKVTQLFTREKENGKTYDRLSNEHRKSWVNAQFTANIIWASVENITCWVMGALYLVGVLALQPAISFGTIVAVSSYGSRFWQPLLNLSSLYNNLINSIAYLERIFELMDEPITVDDAPSATVLPPISGDVTFADVTFAYVAGSNILEHVSFEAKAGESIALVGPTGAGKSTIVNLISRFYNISSGKILIDGVDISGVTLHSLRSQMGIMLQDSFIFSGTIMDNIRYAKLNATDEEVRAACQTVCADEFIEEMEDGYYTQVNERGTRLSQGQRQLVSFARTLLADPKILILDEATSSIDAKTERLVQNAIDKLLKGRTSFIIAHRLSTIKNCDKIMYISDKGILECGRHEELLAKKGAYFKLYTSQISE